MSIHNVRPLSAWLNLFEPRATQASVLPNKPVVCQEFQSAAASAYHVSFCIRIVTSDTIMTTETQAEPAEAQTMKEPCRCSHWLAFCLIRAGRFGRWGAVGLGESRWTLSPHCQVPSFLMTKPPLPLPWEALSNKSSICKYAIGLDIPGHIE